MPHVEVISSQTRDVSTLIFQKKIEIKVIWESSLENGLYCKILRLTRSLEKYCETFFTITLTSRKVDKGRIYHYIRQSQTQSRYHPRKLFLICHCSPCKKPLDSLLTRKKKVREHFPNLERKSHSVSLDMQCFLSCPWHSPRSFLKCLF